MSLMRVRRYMEMLQSGFPACSQECDDVPLCKGGDLSIPMLLAAYGKGIFPWFNEGDPRALVVPRPALRSPAGALSSSQTGSALS